MARAVHAQDVIEVVDEGNNVLLIFPDKATLSDYDRAQLDGEEFDFDRIERQALDLAAKLDSFLDDLRELTNSTRRRA